MFSHSVAYTVARQALVNDKQLVTPRYNGASLGLYEVQ